MQTANPELHATEAYLLLSHPQAAGQYCKAVVSGLRYDALLEVDGEDE